MIRILLENGDTFTSETYADLVQQMSCVFPRGETMQQYMEGVAKRAKIWNETDYISTKDPKTFIEDLHRIGVVLSLEDG